MTCEKRLYSTMSDTSPCCWSW